jgi:phosphoesterase RecJ-like protein
MENRLKNKCDFMECNKYQHYQKIKDIYKYIKKKDNFIITTHVRPDGDCLASVLVFTYLLKHLGKNYLVLIDDNIQAKFDFLPGIEEINRLKGSIDNYNPEVLIVLDSTSLERIGKIFDIVSKDLKIINIDHHSRNAIFGHLNLVDFQESSTVELVYRLLLLANMTISKEIAILIYTGIICDTGRFLFTNTNERSLLICAEMIRKGASPDDIAKNLYYRCSGETVVALANALSTLEFHLNDTVVCIYLSNGNISSFDKIDTEGFVDYLRMIKGADVNFFMLEVKPHVFRVSFRSKSLLDVGEVARNFGGGGHALAAGCTINGTLESVKGQILQIINKHYTQDI